jgi:nitroimidazol reductase NimA-like FMN-containing flavoprotein (pyridoxamine 5'-phosphate oxidase superfamily)
MPAVVLKDLNLRDCLSLLPAMPVGRLIYIEQGQPQIRTANFVVIDGNVILRGSHGSWADKINGAAVAFEADQIDPDTHIGWNVIVHGHATVITDPAELASLSYVGRTAWVDSANDRFLKVDTHEIVGQRVQLISVLTEAN